MYVIVFCASIFITSSLAATERCIPSENKDYSSCACELNSTKQYINLYPLMNSSDIPRFTTNKTSGKGEEDWKFSYNPCKPFDMVFGPFNKSVCKEVAVSRWGPTHSPSVCDDIGVQDNMQFDTTPYNLSSHGFDWANLTLMFPSRTEEKVHNRAIIHLVCNANSTKEMSSFHYLYEVNGIFNDYYFALESRCSCPGLCGKPPPLPEPSSQPSKDKDDKWIIIGVTIGAIIFLLLVILAVICCRNSKKAGYTEV